MNIIHEQCPNSDSETVPSPKTRSKLSQVHKAPNLAQPAHTGAPKRARVAMSWHPQPVVSQAPSVVSQHAGDRVVAAAWPCRRRCPCAVSWPGWSCRGPVSRHRPVASTFPLVTIHWSVLRYNPLVCIVPAPVTIQILYRD